MPRTGLGLMAKFPTRGLAKTRLAADVGDEEALQVYRRLLRRTLRTVTALDREEFHVASFVTPSDKLRKFADRFPGCDSYLAQSGGDLGHRMAQSLEELLEIKGVDQAILIGADIPEISPELLITAAERLRRNDLVLGPTEDGGYYLIGMRRVHSELFDQIPWGTKRVLGHTLDVARRSNLDVSLLDVLRDLDDADDLEHFLKIGMIDDG